MKSPEALAKRAVACKHWEWMEGMLLTSRRRGIIDYGRIGFKNSGGGFEMSWRVMSGETGHAHSVYLPDDALPDLSDPATRGCLLALVRKAYSDAEIHIWVDRGWPSWAYPDGVTQAPGAHWPNEPSVTIWRVSRGNEIDISDGPTEEFVLVDALEAAP